MYTQTDTQINIGTHGEGMGREKKKEGKGVREENAAVTGLHESVGRRTCQRAHESHVGSSTEEHKRTDERV